MEESLSKLIKEIEEKIEDLKEKIIKSESEVERRIAMERMKIYEEVLREIKNIKIKI